MVEFKIPLLCLVGIRLSSVGMTPEAVSNIIYNDIGA